MFGTLVGFRFMTTMSVNAASPLKSTGESGEVASPVSGSNLTEGRPLTELFFTNVPGCPTPPGRTPLVAVRSRPLPLESGHMATGLPSANKSVSARYQAWRCFCRETAFGSRERTTVVLPMGGEVGPLGQIAPAFIHVARVAIS